MVDSNLLSPSENAIPNTFGLGFKDKQCQCQRLICNLLLRHGDENWSKPGIPVEPSDQSDDLILENQRLRRCIDDLIAVLDSPGTWRASEPGQIHFAVQQTLHVADRSGIEAEIDRRVSERTSHYAKINEHLKLQADLLEHLPVSAWTLEPDGTPDFVNRVWLEFSGQTLDFVRSHPEAWMTVVHPDDREEALRSFRDGVSSGRGFAIETRSLRAQDRTYRWHLQQAVPLRDLEGRLLRFVGTTTDIDDLKRAEEALQRKDAFLEDGQRLSSIGSFSWCLASKDIAFSEELYRIFEFDSQMPLRLRRIVARVHPEDVALLSEKFELARSSISRLDYEIRLKMPDGRIKYLHVRSHGTRHGSGRLEHVGAVQDITQRRLADEALSNLRLELAHMARVTTLGTLTASIAHEVNQPLSGIITNTGTCLRRLSSQPADIEGACEAAQRALRDANRASEIIAGLRNLFTKREASNEAVELNDAAREVIMLCSEELQRNGVTIRQEFANDIPWITGDRIQLQQVIVNLVRNASDAMAGVNDRPRVLVIRTEKASNDEVRLDVHDTGSGVAPPELERLFEPFHTTKKDGMGIGLSVSRSIIATHDGQLWATPNDGPGMTFSFSIPSRSQTEPTEEGSAN